MMLLLALLIIIGTFSTKIATKSGLPALLIFLAIGVIFGSDFLNLINFDNAQLAGQIANIALIFVLFESGFQTKREELKSYAGPSMTLATLGIAVTAGVLGGLIYLIIRPGDIFYSLMIGTIISSTDASAVMMIFRKNSIKRRVSSTLEVESAANDPAAILLTMLMIEIVSGNTGSNVGIFITKLAWQLLGGLLVGFVLGWIACKLFNYLKSENKGYYYVLIIGVSIFIYSLAELVKANGVIAVFFAGYNIGNTEFTYKRGISYFLDGIATLSNMTIFLMLGLLVSPKQLQEIWKEGILLAILMMFIARPVAVFLCTLPFKFQFREKLLLSWGGIKGAVPIVLSTYPMLHGIDESGKVFNIVFFAVVLSCVLQGTTITKVAKLLKLLVPPVPRSPYSLELLTTNQTDVDMYELPIEEKDLCCNKKIMDLKLPEDVLITSIVRNDKLISPKGNTEIQPNDILFFLSPINKKKVVSKILRHG
ncbi:MAG: potassium/proton antiporter [Spirochaetales bacterium]|nr:potassium/proton antiporter [Spirochaetales bacterium]